MWYMDKGHGGPSIYKGHAFIFSSLLCHGLILIERIYDQEEVIYLAPTVRKSDVALIEPRGRNKRRKYVSCFALWLK